MNRGPAQRLAEKIKAELQPFCSRIAIAGSIRRQRAEVNDIDLVLIPNDGIVSMRAIIERCSKSAVLIRGDVTSQNITLRLPAIQLDLFVAHAGIDDLICSVPSNWGAVLLCRTGSQEHNTQLAAFAKTKGLKFAPYVGITDGSKILGSKTEEEIYQTLGLPWLEPTLREELR
jgi:DNA polymerase (family 10)